MCGFAGSVNFTTPPLAANCAEMTETLHARGPDATRFWHDEACAFGHKRLIVIDPEGGKQPYAFNEYRLVYNGELDI